MKLKCAILDDYQQVALKMADWSALADRVEVSAISAQLNGAGGASAGVRHSGHHAQRTPMTASLLARLPKLEAADHLRHAQRFYRLAAAAGAASWCGTSSGSAAPMELTRRCCSGWRSISCRKASGCKNGPWQQDPGVTLQGKRWGCWGWARSAARWPGGAGVRHAGAGRSQNATAERRGAGGTLLAPSKRALFEQSDFVSIHRC